MGARMFEDLVLSSPAAAVRRAGVSWPLSIAIHAAALAVLLLASALRPGVAPPLVEGMIRWRPDLRPAPTPPPDLVRAAVPHPRRSDMRPSGPTVAVPAAAPAAVPIDEPPGPPTDDAPPPCLSGCEGTVPGGEIEGVIGDDREGTSGPAPGVTPVRIHTGIKPPTRIAYVAPAYPSIAIVGRIPGTVILDCTIDADGRVVDVRVLTGHPLFNAAAIDAVRQWRYTPTLLNGVPVPVLMTVTVRFAPAK